MTKFRNTAALSAAVILSAGIAQANVTINFENGYTDNEELSDNEVLLDSSGVASIVSIFTQNANTMSVEASGDSSASATDEAPDGFVNDPLGDPNNDIATGSQTPGLGNFFLRTTEALNVSLTPLNPVFTLKFSKNVLKADGEIWDIDGNGSQGTEKWDVIARLADGTTETITSPEHDDTSDTGSLNGQPWKFAFAGSGEIESIDFFFRGTKTEGIGVAFDNLNVSPVPLPAGVLLLGLGLGGLAIYRRRQAG